MLAIKTQNTMTSTEMANVGDFNIHTSGLARVRQSMLARVRV